MGEHTADTALLLVDKKPTGKRAPQKLELAEHAQLGRFGLIRELARGGMGQVFLARDTKLGRKVAIKFLLDNTPSFVTRFLIEARATALCTHENIVTIYEVGEHEGLPFMVLEYLKGQTLTQLLAEKMAPRPFSELMLPVVRALERAHEHGIVHRDLKPSNIFVTDRGVVKVLDFGVAKLFESPAEVVGRAPSVDDVRDLESAGSDPVTYVTFSGKGWIVGTLPYMSPEQWGAGEVDHASDLWALGILFWRALVGVHPAGTADPVKLHARMTDTATPMPSIGAQDPALPSKLVAIVDRCLAMDKAARYASATELLADLQAFVTPRARGDATGGDGSPYRGLAAFGETDAKFFFGRSGEIRAALAQLESWPLLAIIGPSGVGKSSFVHAGLLPAVRTSGAWTVRVLRPGRAPLTALASVLDEALEPGELTELLATLHEAPGQFGAALRRHANRTGTRIMIVVDQLEELFTLSDDPIVRDAFLAALFAAADDPSSPVRVVLSMRADFLDRLASDKLFLSELTRGLFFLAAPDRDNLREILVRPAELAGYAFEDDAIIEDIMQATTTRGALPLLQFAATRLWDARDRKRRLLTQSSYEAMGKVGGAFVRHADEVAAAVPAQHQHLLRAIFTRLVTPEGTRAVIDRPELLSLSANQDDVARILDQLLRARLVHVHSDPSTGATVELVHEVLISEWPTLRRWLEDEASVRAFLHELRQAAKKWTAHGRRADLVWRGNQAHEALAVAERHVLDLPASERDFLAEVATQSARVGRRRLIVFGAIIAVLVVVIGLGAIGLLQISDARELADQRAVSAANEAQRAREAEAASARELEARKAEESRRLAAETEARTQSTKLTLEEQRRAQIEIEKRSAEEQARRITATLRSSTEDHDVQNAELSNAVDTLERERATLMRQLEAARRDFEETRLSNMRLQTQLATEKQRVKQLEDEKPDSTLR